LSGKSFALDVEPYDSIETVKRLIEETDGYAVDRLRLISPAIGGRELENNRMVADCNIQPSAPMLIVTIRSRG
jgi:ubiquitin C